MAKYQCINFNILLFNNEKTLKRVQGDILGFNRIIDRKPLLRSA